MIHATPQDLLKHVATSVTALSEVASPDDKPVVEATLLRLTIEGNDRSDYAAVERDAADEALENIQNAIERGNEAVDTYISGVSVTESNALLKAYSCDISLYQLYGLRTDEDVTRRYKDAITGLGKINKGEIKIGVKVAEKEAAGSIEYSAPERVFDNTTLRDF